MRPKIMIALASIIILLLTSTPILSAQTKEETISKIEKGLIDMFVAQVAYYAEFNQYSDSLDGIGIDKTVYGNYWDLRLYSFKEGFVIEARGIRSPVLGEIRSIDDRGVVVGGR